MLPFTHIKEAITRMQDDDPTFAEANIFSSEDENDVFDFFEALKTNTHLKNLRLEERVSLTDEAVVAIAESLKGNSTLEILDLEASSTSDVGVMAIASAVENNQGLQRFDLSFYSITEEQGAKALAAMVKNNSSMLHLGLSFQFIDDSGFETITKALQHNSALCSLSLTFFLKGINDSHLKAISDMLKYNSAITSISLSNDEMFLPYSSNTTITDAGIKDIARGLKIHAIIETLKFNHIPISRLGAVAIGDAIKMNTNLKCLYIDSTTIDNVEALAEGIKGTKYLEELHLAWNDTVDENVRELGEALKNNTSLRILNLSSDSIRDVSTIADAVKESNCLTELNMYENKIDDEGCLAIGDALEHNSTLKKLRLSDNEISNAGAKALANGIRHNQTLEELQLDFNRIADDGTVAIADALKINSTLKVMDLGSNSISNAGAKALAEMIKSNSSLKDLCIAGNPDITQSGLLELARALPDMQGSINLEIFDDSKYTSYFLADMLAWSSDRDDLRASLRIIRAMSDDNKDPRAEWLIPFIDDQLSSPEISAPSFEFKMDIIQYDDVRYIAQIGRGQFGKVYLARYKGERLVAIKFLNFGLLQFDDDINLNVLRERFACKLVASNLAPNIVKYVGLLDATYVGQRGLVFELCADISDVQHDIAKQLEKTSYDIKLDALPDFSKRVRSSLRSAVVFAAPRRHDVPSIVQMMRKIAQALKEVHTLGFIHRDIADRNILCDPEGNVQLADFGLSKYVGKTSSNDPIIEYEHFLTDGHHYAVAWWAPECICSSQQQIKGFFSTDSDIYSFGVLMWQCFAHGDPFDGLEPTQIIEKILNGERPNLEQLDHDTPIGLGELIGRCWATDPNERPSLDDIRDTLENLDYSNHRVVQNKRRRIQSHRYCQKRWFDVERMYLELPTNELKTRLDASRKESSCFDSQFYLRQLANVRHKDSPSQCIRRKLAHLFSQGRYPSDVFLVHTGQQKKEVIAPLYEQYKSCGLDCFFDLKMSFTDGSNVETMKFALETCRYALVVISKEFLERKDPVNELIYVFKRREWINRQDYKWESMCVILYNMTVADYKEKSREDKRLPNITSSAVVYEWSKYGCHYESWPHMYNAIKADMISKSDIKDGAIDKWRRFLQERGMNDGTDFPEASDVYD